MLMVSVAGKYIFLDSIFLGGGGELYKPEQPKGMYCVTSLSPSMLIYISSCYSFCTGQNLVIKQIQCIICTMHVKGLEYLCTASLCNGHLVAKI